MRQRTPIDRLLDLARRTGRRRSVQLAAAEDVGRAVLWFASLRAARQVTGQMISVSGGYTMP